ncbi:MAG: hypothetical protein ABIH23_00900, partial [bacterium]
AAGEVGEDALHYEWERNASNPNEQMEVVRHEAIGVDVVGPSVHHRFDDAQEVCLLAAVIEDVLAAGPPRIDVEG